MPCIFTFEIFYLTLKREKGRSLKRVKKEQKKRGLQQIEYERRKANKLSRNQNQRKGRIGQPTKKLRDEQN